MSEDDMIKKLLIQINNIRSVRKVFMKKRDVRVYDNSLKSVSEQLTEYDVEIIADMIKPNEWQRIVNLEKEFGRTYPDFRFNYNLIESGSNKSNHNLISNGKLIYDSERPIKV